jgi:hypothetical protein
MKYTFIHPTKNGGTSCEIYFDKYYKEFITGIGHSTLCGNSNNSIIIIRDVVDRFKSMYKYWKYGAIDTHFKRDYEFIKKYKNYTIKDFILLIKNQNKEHLHVIFTWSQHFEKQVKWINNTDYKNIIIIKYEKNLNEKINKLISFLNIPNQNITLPIMNISNDYNEKIILDNSDMDFIKEYFKEDFELLDNINNNPELFKIVI